MDTPIYDFVKAYAQSDTIRAHMPGHKGRAADNSVFAALNPYDITEIHGADSLFEASGIIAKSEENAARLFGTKKTVYSAGGSTLCIQTMLALSAPPRSTVVAARNCHRAFLSACIFLDLDVEWIYPVYESGSLVSGNITGEMVELTVSRAKARRKNVSCVYITSPDYLGKAQNIPEIAEVCHRNNLRLLTDNAHGAYLAFAQDRNYPHPIACGADICCDSAHKTLPVLTGGAYLHFAKAEYADNVKETMSLFGSTSPSYLILQSLDLCNRYISEKIKGDISAVISALDETKKRLSKVWSIENTEPAKLTIFAADSGRTGIALAHQLRNEGIECEYADSTHTVLMFSSLSSAEDISRTEKSAYCRRPMAAPQKSYYPENGIYPS